MAKSLFNRRTFSGLIAGAATFPGIASAQGGHVPFYASTGPNLILYGLDVATGAISQRSAVTLPSNVQYAWPDPGRGFLYVVASNNKPGGLDPDAGGHCAQAFKVGEDGTLTAHGALVKLRQRPIYASTDHIGHFLITAYNMPSAISVHAINADKTIGSEIRQQHNLDTGIYAHQVRATPSDQTVVLVTRGNDATPSKPEDPGALKVYRFNEGRLSNGQSLAPHGNGLSFGPRHLDFHPTSPFVYVSLERENSLAVYGLKPDGTLSDEPLFVRAALAKPDVPHIPGQTAGPIHVHPNGRFVYLTNRGSGTVDFNGQKVWNGGVNNIAVFALDQRTGEPTLIQHADAHGFELRTFTIDAGGKLLIAASQTPMLVRDGDSVRRVSAGLEFHRIGADGRLTFLRKQDVDTTAGTQFWCGLLTMA